MAGGFSKLRLRRLSDGMRAYVERAEVAGIVALLARGDDIHVETIGVQDLETGAPMRRDTLFRIASMTKPVTAVLALSLVEETILRLDDPVERWLPELADRRVLRTLDSALDDTVPADRKIAVRDLLTFRLGVGAVMAAPGTYPIQKALQDAGVAPGPEPIKMDRDTYIARIGSLPLLHQPGAQWMYDTGSDVLGVLIARALDCSLGAAMEDRIFAPLGMADTQFCVPERNHDRLATAYKVDQRTGQLAVWDSATEGEWSHPPAFHSGAGGLVSTADDFLIFARMLMSNGASEERRILARPSVQLMTTDQLTPAQKAASPFFPGFWDTRGWGMGVAVHTVRDGLGFSPGSYGWDGGYGTSWINDPAEDLTAIFLMQRNMNAPNDYQINSDFFTLAYQALED
jgi:CubicO group peptidase (beta-lactamase class C family)